MAFTQEMYYKFTDAGVMSVTQSQLIKARTIPQIHDRFCADCVKKYLTTELTVVYEQTEKSATGNSIDLNESQKQLISNSQVGTQLQLKVRYIPENNLSHNPPQEMEDVFHVLPATLPAFAQGTEALYEYVDNEILQHMTKTQKDSLDYIKMDFDVNINGEIENTVIVRSSGDSTLDELISTKLCNMPRWIAARTSYGIPVNHTIQFFLSPFDKSCSINL